MNIQNNYGELGYGQGPYGGVEAANVPHQSIFLQQLLNYFDDQDIRIRENPVSLGAQLLNSAALQIEQLTRTLKLELGALTAANVPLNVDNAGVYQAVRVPLTFSLPNDNGVLLPPSSIVGTLPNGNVTLVPYFDDLPIPTRVSVDSSIKNVAMSNPVIVDVTGTGSTLVVNPVMVLPNRLTFVIEGMGPTTSNVSIRITGELDPPAVWYQDVHLRTETLFISDDGVYSTSAVWSSLQSISITGLPSGCRLRCWNLPVNLPAEPDLDRQFTHFAYRDILYPRFWQLSGLLLQETYKRSRFSGYEIVNPYLMLTPMVDVAVEPNTFGLFLTDGLNLHYIDRRTPLPSNLDQTGLVQEPLYGLNAYYDFTKPGANRWVQVQPVGGAKASQCTQYRYTVEDPNTNRSVLNPDGSFSTLTGGFGWVQGKPAPVSFPVTIAGTYTITLEMLDQQNNRTYDIFPYANLSTSILSTLDLASLVPSVQGIAFDAYQRLWVWTGSFAIPLKLMYDAYIFDPDTRTIFMTDSYSQIKIS